MSMDNWNALATGLADYVSGFQPHSRRGALAIRLPLGAGEVVGVFGNDGYAADGRVKTEVATLRRQLREAALEELGFGLSADGVAWALLVGQGQSHRQLPGCGTPAEALATFLNDAVWEAWRIAGEVPPVETSAERIDPVQSPGTTERATKGATEPCVT